MARPLLFALTLLAVGCPKPTPTTTPDAPVQLTVLHTNDHHGRFWQNDKGEYGMAARKTLIDGIRAEVEGQGGTVLLLSGGDINTGVPESDLQDAEPDFKGMARIGYDAMALGNHEFDNPLDVLRTQQSWVPFPMLSANVYGTASGERLFKPYEIFVRGGLRIGVIGLTTDDTAKIGNPEYLDGITFKDPIAEAAALVTELRDDVDVLIAATHMGHYENGRNGINAPGDVALARAVSGLDLVVGGHSQDPVCMAGANDVDEDFSPGDACAPDQQNGAWIVQAHEWGKYVGRADFVLRDGVLTLERYQLLPVNLTEKVEVDGEMVRQVVGEPIAEDAELRAFLEPFQQRGQAELSVVVAETDGRLEGDRDVVRFGPTNLGELIATAQMRAADAHLGVVNAGGVRDSIEAGDIAYKDVLRVQPFGNAVAYVELSGADLKTYLTTIASMPVDSGSFGQFAGVRFVLEGGEIRDLVVSGRGQDEVVRDDGVYRMAISSFLASGGDKYPVMDDRDTYVSTGLVDAAVLKDFLAAAGTVRVADYPADQVVRK
jgi:5'-nucleotidase/UDP-sugar diphosphatase